MHISGINYLAVLACGVVSLLIGGFWYGAVFKNAWVALVNKSEDEIKQMEKDAPKAYIGAFIASLVMGFVLSYIAIGMKSTSLVGGLMTGFFIWLGITLVFRLNDIFFEKRPAKLIFINAGFELVVLLAMSVIVSLWR
jgi:Protein of unknown function (DUF1761)